MTGAPLFSGEWQLLKETPTERVWIAATEDPNTLVVKRETLNHSLIAESNAELAKANEGKRWGESPLVARVPLDIWFRDLREATEQGDHKYKARYLNRDENAWMRTKRGNI